MDVMNHCARLSGLCINVAKSSLFAAGIGADKLITAANEVGITVGSLPIRYLGLPLTTRTMTKLDYEPLLDKFRTRFVTWSHKTLSFAGRLQLIRSVVASITNFWCSTFILPMCCFDAI